MCDLSGATNMQDVNLSEAGGSLSRIHCIDIKATLLGKRVRHRRHSGRSHRAQLPGASKAGPPGRDQPLGSKGEPSLQASNGGIVPPHIGIGYDCTVSLRTEW